MAELIGLISSIIGIAGAGLTLAQKLHDYGDGVSGSSRRAQQIASYVRTTAICIEEVGSVLEEERVSDRVIVSRNALDTVRDIVGQCDGLFEQIEAALRSTGSGNGMGRLLFPFRESRVVLMQSDLERLKTTLQLLMQVVVYARVRAVQSEYQPRQRQLVEELIALRRQAMDTYERSRKEDERVEAMEDASIFTAALPGAATGPSASDNVAREIPPTAKGDDNLENPKSNPTVDHPPQTQDSSPDTSNMEITTIQPPDPNPTDSSNQPMSTSTARTQDTVEPVPPTHIPLHPIPRPQPTTPPAIPNTPPTHPNPTKPSTTSYPHSTNP
ncbi:hypothetical protein BO94DRAFT_623167 [Aspergillus sclerotioniger CBS 115572]|uniref:Fungal N-terminal domain-containing protein n=1 Tax=Aspergillus sclerotioniger CBS 115572 TaxID=1450535 RepID=A0A317WYG2_9EURO|nr:hypothetical protein BO94DRAFT_623167 [Aspergillus sclerotioniger CBS 115572]PWY90372.1 hypothetical protein BO94DRAFT_623167 [Aspergillus sclerotioniger CBS 115572]